jgi:hypothetical protein
MGIMEGCLACIASWLVGMERIHAGWVGFIGCSYSMARAFSSSALRIAQNEHGRACFPLRGGLTSIRGALAGMEEMSNPGGLKWTPTARKRPLRLFSFICRLLLDEMKLSPNIIKGGLNFILNCPVI